ncbi:lipopolysaccharide biosynthesis protein [Mycobacterium sp. 283mftsu]|nr:MULTISPECIES: lipopolysaccharide biosynthesis protein [unclassified Mycobacterium]
MRWSIISMFGREGSRLIFTVLLARLLGPHEYGVAAQATVLIAIVCILVDQGFSAALIQRASLADEMPGATVSINVAIGTVLTVATAAISPLWAAFMNTPALGPMLAVLSIELVIRSAAITPRAMLIRSMQFRTIAIVDTLGVVSGGAFGLVAALIWHSAWAIVIQLIATDLVGLLAMVFMGVTYRPNLRLSHVAELFGFSWRASATGVLLNSVATNVDNVLIGWRWGPVALANYALAYRLLMLPVSLATATVGPVLLSAFSRMTDDIAAAAAQMTRTVRALAILFIPAMALVAVAAPQWIAIFFGPEWRSAVPIIQVMTLAGAVQTVYKCSTSSLLLGFGKAAFALRYALLVTSVTTIGIFAGLPFGVFGVAAGLTTATGLLLPIEWIIRKRVLEIPIRTQITSLLPAVHAGAWVVAVYLGVVRVAPSAGAGLLVVGTTLSVAAAAAVVRMCHRSLYDELVSIAGHLRGRATGVAP